MNLVNYPIFESPVLLFETEQGEFAGSFEGDNILVKLNNDYPNENTKYSIYFLDACIGLDELPHAPARILSCGKRLINNNSTFF